jgi:hypothetical protein
MVPGERVLDEPLRNLHQVRLEAISDRALYFLLHRWKHLPSGAGTHRRLPLWQVEINGVKGQVR